MTDKPKYLKLPLKAMGKGMYIVDDDGEMVAQIRGWGHLTGKGGNGPKLSVDDAIAEQVARQEFLIEAANRAVSGWVKTSERLPEYGVSVLVWSPGWDAACIMSLDRRTELFKNDEGQSFGDPEWWMPMPELPKEDTENAD
jgi:hypothetical protein